METKYSNVTIVVDPAHHNAWHWDFDTKQATIYAQDEDTARRALEDLEGRGLLVEK